jgi:hypothetical protein
MDDEQVVVELGRSFCDLMTTIRDALADVIAALQTLRESD